VEELQLQLGKREEELTQALMKIDEEGAGKAQSQKALRELESQLAEVSFQFSFVNNAFED
jgi:myosin protein heavy chain